MVTYNTNPSYNLKYYNPVCPQIFHVYDSLLDTKTIGMLTVKYTVTWADKLYKQSMAVVVNSFKNIGKWKWNESGFRPPLCTYRLNWARRTSWGWWDDWDDTVLQTQDSKFEPWRSEAEHATSRSRKLPTILTFTRGWGRNIFVSFKPPRPGTEPRTLVWKAAVLTTTLGPPPFKNIGVSHVQSVKEHQELPSVTNPMLVKC